MKKNIMKVPRFKQTYEAWRKLRVPKVRSSNLVSLIETHLSVIVHCLLLSVMRCTAEHFNNASVSDSFVIKLYMRDRADYLVTYARFGNPKLRTQAST